MDNVRPLQNAEQPQLELGFTLDGSLFADELQDIDPLPHSLEPINRRLAVTSMTRMTYDPTNKYERASFEEYQRGINGLSDNGNHEFELTDFIRPVYYRGPQEGEVVGFKLQINMSTWEESHTILRPPLYGPRASHDPAMRESAQNTLNAFRRTGVLPVKFELSRPILDSEEVLHRLEAALGRGAWVSHMRLVLLSRGKTLTSVG